LAQWDYDGFLLWVRPWDLGKEKRAVKIPHILAGGIAHGRQSREAGWFMTYHFSKTLRLPFDAAIAKVTEASKREGFDILTVQAEDKIGTMLTCNVFVQELRNGMAEVSAVDRWPQ
jgi:hypothetical protein